MAKRSRTLTFRLGVGKPNLRCIIEGHDPGLVDLKFLAPTIFHYACKRCGFYKCYIFYKSHEGGKLIEKTDKYHLLPRWIRHQFKGLVHTVYIMHGDGENYAL